MCTIVHTQENVHTWIGFGIKLSPDFFSLQNMTDIRQYQYLFHY